MPRISVITPARDVQAYIEPLLQDLRAQSWHDFEAIVVDDGSTDGTRAILDAAAQRDPRFRVLETDGQGTSAARNRGLEVADGEEIAFIDADDRLSHRYLETLHHRLTDSGSDMAVANARRLDGFTTLASGLHLRALATAFGTTHLRRSPELVYDTTIWNKLIRRHLWDQDGLRFDDGRIVNDIYPSLRTHVLAQQVHVSDEVLYYWRVREDPTGSITDSKLSDHAARQRSLDDRLFAVQRTRRMLAADLPEPSVLLRFDERVLAHDMWVYLPLYHESDDHYRRTLEAGIRDYLQTFDIDPPRFPLGPVLTGAYEAILRTDDERLSLLLDPDTRVVADSGRRSPITSVQLGSPGQTRRRSRSWMHNLFGRRPGRPTLEAEVQVARVHLPRESDVPLRVTGQVRVRDGRSLVDTPWELSAHLVGRTTRVLIQGGPASVAPDPEPELHPLQRRGWRTFDASVALPTENPDEVRWDLALSLHLDGHEVEIKQRLSRVASRHLALSVPIGIDVDLSPTVTASGRLSLRRVAAPLRLTSIDPEWPDRLVLQFDRDLRDHGVRRLWFADKDGRATMPAHLRGATTAVVAHLEEPGSDLERSVLWCEAGDHEHRVRAATSLATVTVGTANDPARELVVRPTARGNVVFEGRAPRPQVTWTNAEASSGAMTVGGPRLPACDLAAGNLELRCRWTEDRFEIPIATSDAGWFAQLQPEALLGHSGGTVRPRTLDIAVGWPDGVAPVHVAPEIRHRFPLTEVTGACAVELRVGPGGWARLWVAPRIESGV